jgi:acetyl esterase/lipase
MIRIERLMIAVGASASLALLCGVARSAPPMLQADGTVHMPESDYPMPASFSPEARKAFLDYFTRGGDPAITGDIDNVHRVYDNEWAGPILKRWEALYSVKTERTTLAGVTVDIVTPASGVGLTGALVSLPSSPPPSLPSYFSRTDFDDPMAAPAESPEILALFPPTLVLSSSRDALLGSALDTYAKLRDARVESELYVRHGFGHGYFTQAPGLPEATAAWQEAVRHFDRYLGAMKGR